MLLLKIISMDTVTWLCDYLVNTTLWITWTNNYHAIRHSKMAKKQYNQVFATTYVKISIIVK